MVLKLKLFALLAISLVGFVLFFPIKVDRNSCCLGEAMASAHATSQQHHAHANMMQHARDHRHLARQYLFPYGFLWWGSIALGYWSVTKLINERKTEHSEKHKNRLPTHWNVTV
jgi:hypothetical protein